MGGKRELVASLSAQQAHDMGFDGLIIEEAIYLRLCTWSDKDQVTPEALSAILDHLVYR